MSYEKVKQATDVKIGLKQTMKAIENGDVDEVIIAKDADAHIVKKILRSCEQNKIICSYVDSKKKLGKTCGIDVGAATVAIKR